MLAQVTAKISGIPFIVHSVHTDKQICSSILQLFLTVLVVQYVWHESYRRPDKLTAILLHPLEKLNTFDGKGKVHTPD